MNKTLNLAKIAILTLAVICASIPSFAKAGGLVTTECAMELAEKIAPIISVEGSLFRRFEGSYYVFTVNIKDHSCLKSLDISISPTFKKSKSISMVLGLDLFDVNGQAIARTGAYSAKYSTEALLKGKYLVRIVATDVQNNVAIKNITLEVK